MRVLPLFKMQSLTVLLILLLCLEHVSAFAALARSITTYQQSNSKRKDCKIATTHLHATETTKSVITEEHTNICQHCGSEFASRNAIFRHLRSSSNDCSNESEPTPQTKRKVAIHFGYHSINHEYSKDAPLPIEERVLSEAFSQALASMHPGGSRQSIDITGTSFTAKVEQGCAFGNVFGITYMDSNDQIDDTQNEELISRMQDCIRAVPILGIAHLAASTKFDADRSCTQRTYQYLLPFHWLNDGDEAAAWAKEINRDASHQDRSGTKRSTTPIALMRLKDALKQAESRDSSKSDDGFVCSPGRFGSLWRKERRCWHNFCDLPPSNEGVWGTVDRARVAGFKIHGEEASAVIELRGDDFIEGQLPRIIACVVAIANEWLPPTIFAAATRPNVSIVKPPVAPLERLYFHSARFHFIELAMPSEMFGSHHERRDEWLASLQSRIVETVVPEEELQWLHELRDVTAPQIQLQLENVALDDGRVQSEMPQIKEAPLAISIKQTYSEPPALYQEALLLLKDIAAASEWPSTPVSRSRVIRSVGDVRPSGIVSSFAGKSVQAGSFVVVNPAMVATSALTEQFPDLVKSIFELEAQLAAEGMVRDGGTMRPPSTHCAVNRNAAFTAHTDNGRGRGLSMTVAMGKFAGGGLKIGDTTHDIRFSPLEYDGWKEVHNTAAFEGERFSLTWFTPDQGHARGEDGRAQSIIEGHEKILPSYPILTFRRNSTDSLVVNEILDPLGCAYEQGEFSLRGHKRILDIGAHIGVFTRYALGLGCERVIAYEPEGQNIALLRKNTQPAMKSNTDQTVEIHELAVAHGDGAIKSFVHATSRNDGTLNTWRHSLEEYSNYANDGADLTRTQVQTVPLFGEHGALQQGVTAVKLDCEGAELEILLSAEAAQHASWLDVTHLVFEWSFTKERRVNQFHRAIHNLESAGFAVTYQGEGAWWDTEHDVMWPYHSDLVVYAMMQHSP